MRGFGLVLAFVVALAGMARAENEKAGVFDYYIMALSWSANWCALEGDARGGTIRAATIPAIEAVASDAVGYVDADDRT